MSKRVVRSLALVAIAVPRIGVASRIAKSFDACLRFDHPTNEGKTDVRCSVRCSELATQATLGDRGKYYNTEKFSDEFSGSQAKK